ncbi:Uncharacterized protein PBTT_10305 [Plasmodiophora brassicae]
MCIGSSVASPPTAHLAPYSCTIGSPASASMQCVPVVGFILNFDRKLIHVDDADALTSSLTIEWASTHDAVDGVVTRSHGGGHVLHLAGNGRHGPVAYIQKEQINGIWTIHNTSHEHDCCIFVNMVPLHYGEVATIEIGGVINITSRDKKATFASLRVG